MANGAEIMERLARLSRRMAQADIAFYLLPFIMLILVAGTVTQRDLGLYAAQKLFFGSFLLWAGPLPLPGFYTLTGLLTCSLLLKFLLADDWSLRKAGIHLTHLGVLVLLLGGLVTALNTRESYMLIAEGDSSPYIYDYRQRELFVFENDHLLETIPFEKLEVEYSGKTPFRIRVKDTCENCAIGKREEDSDTYKGMAQFMTLSVKPPEKEPEENIAGTTFEIDGAEPGGTYIAFEGMPKPIELKAKNRHYKIIFGRRQRALPFMIRLDDFTKETYPGLDKARAYMSDITVIDGRLEWPARIEMNKPLRYRGYTFYQSSFEQGPEGELTILSVVENKGRVFPYIGTALIATGLLLHLFVMIRERKTL
jgi:hypothetical protein